jgi:hypothetical protein
MSGGRTVGRSGGTPEERVTLSRSGAEARGPKHNSFTIAEWYGRPVESWPPRAYGPQGDSLPPYRRTAVPPVHYA